MKSKPIPPEDVIQMAISEPALAKDLLSRYVMQETDDSWNKGYREGHGKGFKNAKGYNGLGAVVVILVIIGGLWLSISGYKRSEANKYLEFTAAVKACEEGKAAPCLAAIERYGENDSYGTLSQELMFVKIYYTSTSKVLPGYVLTDSGDIIKDKRR